ncbi:MULTISPECIES: hypothetical protein [Sphingomonas]|jgi:hypothetical protein|uniref:Lipoprotein n=1 Tax=Sphingomonas zeae TaxID=1646122 RepID=A0A7Y6B5T0_9SPHN|nr:MULTISPECIES: hypothetical protein [Sphingomonas]MBB4048618.1 hypothetical protein [Sphingomonas zeae]MDK8186488.1 hypothetical protein [Sphingomonas zeae]MDK8216147.1 hypothetical protein [Sphingomonas sp. UMB7805-LC452B]NUU47950.1 hypothetical protein [Sphingomonas zeae]
MGSFKRFGLILMTSSACAALSACGGADSVASPGAGSVVIVQPQPTPAPSPTATPTANITAAQFAAVTTVNGVSITADEQLAIVNAGSNNNVNGTGAALNGIYPASSTSLTTAADPSIINGFFTSTNYVGALNGPSDTAFQGWTCNSTSAEFGGSGARCSAVPSIGTYAAATSVCPTGTIDDGTVTPSGASAPSYRFCRIDNTITTTQNVTLPKIAGVVYRLRGQTEVGTDLGSTGGAGVTLTIAPGVVIAADSSEATNDLLLVNRGSKISAVGTRDAPIVFTSQQNLVSNGVSDATQGQWGGIILLGRAPTAVCATGTGPNNAAGSSTSCQLAIEGVTGRFYGGANQADSSGQLSYVQIRYSGIAISDGNELQGLTLGGTGSGTVLDHIQSHNSADDGIEIFGGTSNLKYIAITGADDDGFDIDNGYRGFMQFLIAAQRAIGATADSFSTEIDSNNAEDLLPRTFGRYANFTFVQTALAPAAIRLRGGADMTFINGIVKATQQNVACVNLVAGAGSGADRTTIRGANADLQDVGPPVFTSIYFSCNGR